MLHMRIWVELTGLDGTVDRREVLTASRDPERMDVSGFGLSLDEGKAVLSGLQAELTLSANSLRGSASKSVLESHHPVPVAARVLSSCNDCPIQTRRGAFEQGKFANSARFSGIRSPHWQTVRPD
jgi:hypothetical protein